MPRNKYANPAAPSAFENVSWYPKVFYVKNEPNVSPFKAFVDVGDGRDKPRLSKDCYDRLSIAWDAEFSK